MSALPFLSDAEIAEICAPLEQAAAQVRFLCRQGLVVKRKPNGRPLVARSEFERVMVGRQHEAQNHQQGRGPNRGAFLELVGARRGKKA